jgi:hypothetical protein
VPQIQARDRSSQSEVFYQNRDKSIIPVPRPLEKRSIISNRSRGLAYSGEIGGYTYGTRSKEGEIERIASHQASILLTIAAALIELLFIDAI